MKSETKTKNNQVIHPATPPFAEIQRAIEQARVIYVGSHMDPDGDSLGTQLAVASYLRSLGKRVLLCRDGNIPDKYRFLPGVSEIPDHGQVEIKEMIDTALILECPNRARLGGGEKLIGETTSIINIDHHYDNAIYGQVNWVNSEASSVGEMIYEYLRFAKYALSVDEATLLYTAILTDTGRFRYGSTSSRTMQIAGELIDAGADPYKIVEEVYYKTKPSTTKLLGKVLNGIEFHHDGRLCLLSVTRQMMTESGANSTETEGMVDWTLVSDGVLVGALLKEVEAGQTKVSLRSKGRINVSEIASQFGGGGHVNAAGCSIPKPMAEVRQLIAEILRGAVTK